MYVFWWGVPLLTRYPVQVIRVFPAELRSQGDHESHSPHHDNHGGDPRSVSGVDVIHISHRPVPEIKIYLPILNIIEN